ncbi:uncharacterized protein LOC132635720 [Lycium barbarum]|uniref:uncharacterized protein LOC132635720 n=1 Tax=Lycium barbarum TaxID=112863 RepID=UPI00293E9B94|nr:uncharacterized protein LOC132635720 [Lycium barbarum]XP_060208211.1 uncharacterized protein LOC132635720 [Lycium barbarum]
MLLQVKIYRDTVQVSLLFSTADNNWLNPDCTRLHQEHQEFHNFSLSSKLGNELQQIHLLAQVQKATNELGDDQSLKAREDDFAGYEGILRPQYSRFTCKVVSHFLLSYCKQVFFNHVR